MIPVVVAMILEMRLMETVSRFFLWLCFKTWIDGQFSPGEAERKKKESSVDRWLQQLEADAYPTEANRARFLIEQEADTQWSIEKGTWQFKIPNDRDNEQDTNSTQNDESQSFKSLIGEKKVRTPSITNLLYFNSNLHMSCILNWGFKSDFLSIIRF